jgi:inosine/xanthosine triphosphate pyrophosphatase family protein
MRTYELEEISKEKEQDKCTIEKLMNELEVSTHRKCVYVCRYVCMCMYTYMYIDIRLYG